MTNECRPMTTEEWAKYQKPKNLKTYADKLKDPRWQKKRLQILNRDEFRCCHCHDSDSELHVHHAYYIKSKEPWEYPDDLLFTLCADCHEETERYIKFAAMILSRGGYGCKILKEVIANTNMAYAQDAGPAAFLDAISSICNFGKFKCKQGILLERAKAEAASK